MLGPMQRLVVSISRLGCAVVGSSRRVATQRMTRYPFPVSTTESEESLTTSINYICVLKKSVDAKRALDLGNFILTKKDYVTLVELYSYVKFDGSSNQRDIIRNIVLDLSKIPTQGHLHAIDWCLHIQSKGVSVPLFVILNVFLSKCKLTDKLHSGSGNNSSSNSSSDIDSNSSSNINNSSSSSSSSSRTNGNTNDVSLRTYFSMEIDETINLKAVFYDKFIDAITSKDVSPKLAYDEFNTVPLYRIFPLFRYCPQLILDIVDKIVMKHIDDIKRENRALLDQYRDVIDNSKTTSTSQLLINSTNSVNNNTAFNYFLLHRYFNSPSDKVSALRLQGVFEDDSASKSKVFSKVKSTEDSTAYLRNAQSLVLLIPRHAATGGTGVGGAAGGAGALPYPVLDAGAATIIQKHLYEKYKLTLSSVTIGRQSKLHLKQKLREDIINKKYNSSSGNSSNSNSNSNSSGSNNINSSNNTDTPEQTTPKFGRLVDESNKKTEELENSIRENIFLTMEEAFSNMFPGTCQTYEISIAEIENYLSRTI